MTSKTQKVFIVALLLSSVGVVLGSAAATDTTLADIAQYRQWTRLTEQPVIVEGSFAGLD
jgi:hypothetical protein